MNYENINPEEFANLMDKEDHIVLDVRGADELVEGSIDGYQMINMFDVSFKSEIEKLDQSKSYLVYCRSGNRSGSACGFMSSLGFENLYNLSGGIIAWNRSTIAT